MCFVCVSVFREGPMRDVLFWAVVLTSLVGRSVRSWALILVSRILFPSLYFCCLSCRRWCYAPRRVVSPALLGGAIILVLARVCSTVRGLG